MYSREYKNIKIARKVIEEKSLSVDELWEAYQKMTDKYVTLVDDSKFLTKIYLSFDLSKLFIIILNKNF